MKGRQIHYAPAELAWIEKHRTLPRREAHARFCQAFGRSDVSLVNFTALCKRKGWPTGRTGRFRKGQAPANKGCKMPFNAKSAQTQFKPGNLPHNTRYAGHERICRDGYVEISVEETNPHTGFERRYVQKHRWLWEQANGPVPEGHCLKCLDGDKTNTDPNNWVCIPRAMLPRLNGRFGRGYDGADPAVKPLIMATTRLEHAAREKKKAANRQTANGSGAMSAPTYSDGEYRVEEFDHVEFADPEDGLRDEGQIVRVYPRKLEADVRCAVSDHFRPRGGRRSRTVRLPIGALELVRRDG